MDSVSLCAVIAPLIEVAKSMTCVALPSFLYYELMLRRSARSQARSEAECRHPRLPGVTISPVDGTSLRFVPYYKRHCVT